MHVYLDNAATTPIEPGVADAMIRVLQTDFGNPSSIHSHGREAKTIVEKARKTVAQLLGASPSEIFFTSGGTEADNMAIVRAIEAYGITHAVTSPLEHHAVLHTLEELAQNGSIHLDVLKVDSRGEIDLQQLEDLLQQNPRTFVSLMHGNNELGNLIDLQKISDIVHQYNGIFHSDTVQTVGHYVHDLSTLNIDFITGSAHKFHGPKGIGFLYINGKNKIKPLIYGGAQERNMRGGTENVYGIVGLAKALELAYKNMDEHRTYIQGLKDYFKTQLIVHVPGVSFNGLSDPDNSLYTVLNVSLPTYSASDMLLFQLDIKGISASGGSACSSGSDIGSHVLRAINSDPSRPCVRFSFSKFNTKEEIDFVVGTIAELYPK